MKLAKFIPLLFIITLYSSVSLAESNKDCGSILKAGTGVKMYEKLKCKMSNNGDENFGKKLKNLFKKKD